MRSAPGVFEYMLAPEVRVPPGSTAVPGAAGRGAVCELALHLAGREDLDGVRAGLDVFVNGRATLSSELGKVLIHTGAHAQGSHYLLFDYATAALAVEALPKRERARYREQVLEELLRARTADGSFADNPTSRGVAFGAGMALVALDSLRP